MTIRPRSPRGRPCPIRPRLPMRAPSSRNTGSLIDDAIRRALDDPANESCKPGDTAFARARFELIARPRQSLDAAVKLAQAMLATRPSISAPISKARRARSPPIMRGWRSGARRRQARRDPLRRRADRDRARQWPRRPEPGICAGAGRPAEGHARHRRACRRHRRRRRRRGLGVRSGRRADRRRDICEDEGARASSPHGYLDNNDATAFFAATGDLLQTGPTLTNVNDIRVILVD